MELIRKSQKTDMPQKSAYESDHLERFKSIKKTLRIMKYRI